CARCPWDGYAMDFW
nr:immunoglobulin heavy chain junction region [Mus musculus]MBK4185507.1 immunoglobulin heavy chain junction region [Mus musculus]MBK4185508.1 immunoglobulin heavy chain junction region [Mus musculus]MBK4185509.1 immunoglobulin heavy chain junction region [Mus musculus]